MASKRVSKTGSSRSKITTNQFEDLILQDQTPNRLQIFQRSLSERDYTVAGLSALLTLLLVIVLSMAGIDFSLGRHGSSSSTTVSAASGGQVALTEAQLRAEVKKIKIPVYWVGPQAGALYTLENQADTRVFVRYLPDGKVPPQGEASKRIIGTYVLKGAFDSTKLAGSTIANGLGYVNDDGAAVYYNSTSPTNVYVAFPGQDYQIEIFDPTKGVAVQLATTKGTLQVIK